MRGSRRRIVAERAVAASPPEVFSFLADLENHWLLADRFVEVLTLDRPPGGGPAHGGTVRVRGPLGLARTAHTRVVHAQPYAVLEGSAAVGAGTEGSAAVGAGTEARVDWTLTPIEGGTLVRLEATVERASWFEAILLAAGGRRWLEGRFAAILETLAQRVPAGRSQASSA